jgi:RNA-directed DNA polymerase
MSAKEKSDLPEVARKRANKAASAAAEPVERRGGAKENAELQSTVRTQSREAVSQAQARIREAVTKNSNPTRNMYEGSGDRSSS